MCPKRDNEHTTAYGWLAGKWNTTSRFGRLARGLPVKDGPKPGDKLSLDEWDACMDDMEGGASHVRVCGYCHEGMKDEKQAWFRYLEVIYVRDPAVIEAFVKVSKERIKREEMRLAELATVGIHTKAPPLSQYDSSASEPEPEPEPEPESEASAEPPPAKRARGKGVRA
jgi:hypothetical protein